MGKYIFLNNWLKSALLNVMLLFQTCLRSFLLLETLETAEYLLKIINLHPNVLFSKFFLKGNLPFSNLAQVTSRVPVKHSGCPE